MKDKIKNLRYGIVILIVAILVSIPLCWKNFNYYSDDGIQHIARSFLTQQALNDGQSFTVLSRLENGFGYSWDLFYGPLSSFSIAVIGNIFFPISLLVIKLFYFWGFYYLELVCTIFQKRLQKIKMLEFYLVFYI